MKPNLKYNDFNRASEISVAVTILFLLKMIHYTNDNQKSYAFLPTYGDDFTAFHRHMISVVVFSYSNELQNMLFDYEVTEMG